MCPENIGIMLSKYADGEISAADRATVDEHLRNCADCRALLESFRKTNVLLDDALYSRSFGTGIADALSAQIPEMRRGDTGGMSVRVRWLVRVAAMLLIAIMGGIALYAVSVRTETESLGNEVNGLRHEIGALNRRNEEMRRAFEGVPDKIRDWIRDMEIASVPGHSPDAPQTGPDETGETGMNIYRREGDEGTAVVQSQPFDTFTAMAHPEGILLAWKTDAAFDARQYNIYRRDSGTGEFTGPINVAPLPATAPYFFDNGVVSLAQYDYRIEAVDAAGLRRQSPSVTVTAEYDTEIIHLGAATGLGHEAVSNVKVRRCIGGQWYSEVFPLKVGEAIGCVMKTGGKTVDFSTGYKLVSVEKARRSIPHLRNRQKVNESGKKVVDAEGKPVFEQIVEYIDRNDVKLTVADAAGNPRQIWSGDSIRGGQGKFKD